MKPRFTGWRASCSLPAGRAADAGPRLVQALAVARAQQAPIPSSCEVATLARASCGRSGASGRRGRELLAPVYGWFTEGFDTPDLRDAEGLLAALA